MMVCGLDHVGYDTSLLRVLSGISAHRGGLSTAIEKGVPEHVLWVQSGHAQDIVARRYVSSAARRSVRPADAQGVLEGARVCGRKPRSPRKARHPAVWGRAQEARGGSACGASYIYLSCLSPTLPLRPTCDRRVRLILANNTVGCRSYSGRGTTFAPEIGTIRELTDN